MIAHHFPAAGNGAGTRRWRCGGGARTVLLLIAPEAVRWTGFDGVAYSHRETEARTVFRNAPG